MPLALNALRRRTRARKLARAHMNTHARPRAHARTRATDIFPNPSRLAIPPAAAAGSMSAPLSSTERIIHHRRALFDRPMHEGLDAFQKDRRIGRKSKGHVVHQRVTCRRGTVCNSARFEKALRVVFPCVSS